MSMIKIYNTINIFLIYCNNSSMINILLSLSNLLGICSIYNFILYNRYYLSFCLVNLISVSSLHHLVETNEVGHNLKGIKIYNISRYGYMIRYLDIFTACLFSIITLFTYNINCIIWLVNDQIILIIFSIICSFLCDFIIRNNPFLYFILHVSWHLGVYYIIYKLSLIT